MEVIEWATCPYDKRDWDTYKKLRRSRSNPKSILIRQELNGESWAEDGIEVWAPTDELAELAAARRGRGSNIISMILKVSYKGHSVVLGGDATAEETWPVIYPYTDMSGISVLKASHHGRKSGFYEPAVAEMSPFLTITSVAARKHDATEQYRRHSVYTVSLRRAGDIIVQIDDSGTLRYSRNIEEHWKGRK